MTVTISGSSGITSPGISNSEGYTGDGLSIAAGAPAGAVTVDASGNLSLAKNLILGSASVASPSEIVQFTAAGSAITHRWYQTGIAEFWIGMKASTDALCFGSGAGTGTEAMRFDASGNLMVGTATGAYSVKGVELGQIGYIFVTRDNAIPMWVNRLSSTGTLVEFAYNTSVKGSITTNGSNVAYNTSSDYRLKNTIAPMTGAMAKVALLKPCTYKWNADNSAGEGFIAHELAEVVPQCVTGDKDAVDAEGNPQYQGIDTSFLVATLTAAIQEQQAMINDLKARIEKLEVK